ncbi:hypothetical protein [Riemerella anatipestifer]|uniref:hypothetical protein n=1 Tax=Riemerella anatipestifer TaxID=34085 RepID=UPI0020A6AFDF|nr:hypothetical protein [Riemerella anatipestifer]
MVQRNTANTANIRTSELPNQRLIHDDKTAFDRKYTTESRDCKVKDPSLPLKMIAELAKKKTVFSEGLKNFIELEKQKEITKRNTNHKRHQRMEGITLQRSKEQHRKALEVLEEAKKLNRPVVFLKRGQSLDKGINLIKK